MNRSVGMNRSAGMNRPDDDRANPGALATDAGPADPRDGGAWLDRLAVPQFHWRAIRPVLYRNRYPMAVILLLALLGGVLSILLTQPVYRAGASVQIDLQTARVLGTEDAEQQLSGTEADRLLNTQVEVLKSRAVASRVVAKLGLAGLAGFHKEMGLDAEALRELGRAGQQRAAIDHVQQSTQVSLRRASRIIDVRYIDRDAGRAAQIANALVDAFIVSGLERRFDRSSYSRTFLSNQLALAKGKLEASETELVNYARGASLIDLGPASAAPGAGGGVASLTTADLVQLSTARTQARTARILAEQRWRQAQGAAVMDLPEVLGNPAVQQLTQQRATASAEYEQLRQRLKEDHPELRQAAARLRELDSQIGTTADNLRRAIREQYEVAARQEADLTGSVERLKGATLSEQGRAIRYNILKREVDTNRQMYDALLQRFKEVSAQSGIALNSASVVDEAEPPRIPFTPRPLRSMALAAVLGLLLAGGFAYGREMLDDKIRSPDDVESKLGLRLLGVTPLLKDGSAPREALTDPRSRLSEAFHALHTSLDLATPSTGPQALLITSSRPSEGKSTTAYGLAREFAMAGARVILLDADMRAPSLHRYFHLQSRSGLGLSSLLRGETSVDSVLNPTEIAGLSFISSGPVPGDPARLLSDVRLAAILGELRTHCDVLIVDGPPILGLADALRLAHAVDHAVLVVEADDSHFTGLKASLRRVTNDGMAVLGVVLSKFDVEGQGYGDDYGYYYQGSYGTAPAER